MSEEINCSTSKRRLLDTSTEENSPSLTPTSGTPTTGTEDNVNPGTGTPDSVIVGKKRQRSKVWDHFDKVKVNGLEKAQCNRCNKRLTARPNDGTSHLRDHINKSCILRKNKDIRDMRQQVLVNEQHKKDGQLKGCHFDQEVSRHELVCMIILHEFPLSVVEYVGVRKFCFSLQPLFKVPCRSTIKADVIKIHGVEKDKIMELVEKNQSRVAITTDMWTTANRKRGFMVVTAHYIDDSWVLQNRLLRFIYVPSPHTSEVLSDVLMDCLLEWNIDQKLSTLTVDNCTTNDAMVRNLSDKLDSSSLLLSGSLLHMRCAAHILNLIVQDGLVVIKDCIEKIRDSVIFWTASTKRRQKFTEVCRQVRVTHTKELVLDVKTRWNSTFLMLSTALLYKDVFFRLNQRELSYNCMPNEDEWTWAKDICNKLELFHSVTELFSGTSYPTSNVFFPKVCTIKIQLTEWSLSSDFKIKEMALSMLGKFNSYWDVIHGIMGVAAMLDPQFKMVLVKFLFGKIYGNRANLEIERIKNICYDLLDEYKFRNMDCQEKSSTLPIVVDGESSNGDILLDFDLLVSSQNQNVGGKKELDHYLDDAVLPRSSDFDILSWWKNNGVKYPTLRLIARDILAIPVSTVASESAFSRSGRLLSPHRSRLKENTVEALMCTQNWLWAQTKGSSLNNVVDKVMQNILNVEEESVVEDEDDVVFDDILHDYIDDC